MIGETREEGKAVTRTNYAYDKAGQLTSFRRSDGNAEQYKYDPAGNMVEKVQNGVKIAMTYTAANELQSMESPHGKLTYAYDANGNLTQKTYNNRTDTYSYDARNHLRQYKGYDNYTVKYSYNALGMLHAKEASGNSSRTTLEELIAGKEASDDPDGDGDKPRTTTYVYDLTQPYYEVLTESTDGKVTSYTYGLERLAAYTESARTAYLYDGRGSVIQANGESKFYSSFGELLTEKTSGYGFNGEYFDAATGMLNLRARQYEPAQGRFSQKDSEKGYVTNARSLNAYLYCYNDGVNYFDASGAAPEAIRNNTTVDAGDGGSYAARSAKAQAEQARKEAARRATKPTSREQIAQDNPEEMARSEYTRKQGSAPTVGGNSLLGSGIAGACTEGRSSPDYTMFIYDGITITIDHNPDLSTKNETPPALYEVTVRDGITIIAHNIPSGATVTVRDGITIIEHPIEEQEKRDPISFKNGIKGIIRMLQSGLDRIKTHRADHGKTYVLSQIITYEAIKSGEKRISAVFDREGNIAIQKSISGGVTTNYTPTIGTGSVFSIYDIMSYDELEKRNQISNGIDLSVDIPRFPFDGIAGYHKVTFYDEDGNTYNGTDIIFGGLSRSIASSSSLNAGISASERTETIHVFTPFSTLDSFFEAVLAW